MKRIQKYFYIMLVTIVITSALAITSFAANKVNVKFTCKGKTATIVSFPDQQFISKKETNQK